MLHLLGPLGSLLGLEAGSLVDKAKRAGVMWAAIGVLAAIAIVFLLVALHSALTLWVGPIWAPVIIAAGAAIIALAIFVIARIASTVEHRREVERRRSAETTALVTTAAVTALPMLLKSPLIKSIGLPLGGALAALFLLSRSGPSGDDEEA